MVDRRKAYSYFHDNFHLKRSSGGWWSFHCPFCDLGREKWKGAVRFDWQRCKCWECGYNERILNFVADTESLTTYQAMEFLNGLEPSVVDLAIASEIHVPIISHVTLPPGFVGIMEGTTHHANLARTYLTNRGFKLEDMDRLGVGYSLTVAPQGEDNYFGYIIIPFTRRGALVYYIARAFLGYEPKYQNPSVDQTGMKKSTLLYNEDALELRKMVWVNEGVMDAWMYGKYGVATLGWAWSPDQTQKLLNANCKRLVIVPDVGFYNQAVRSCMPLLGKKDLKVLNMDELAHLGNDTNKIGLKPVLELYERTPLLTFRHAVEAVNSY